MRLLTLPMAGACGAVVASGVGSSGTGRVCTMAMAVEAQAWPRASGGTSTALLHAQPRAAPRAPPASRPAPARSATRSGPAGPGPASAAPPAGRTPPGRSGRCSLGEGSQGRPRPRGAATRKHPASRVSRRAHAGTAQPDSGSLPPRSGGCVSGGSVGSGLGSGSRSPSTPTGAPGPVAAGHCWSTKGLAPWRPPYPLCSSS